MDLLRHVGEAAVRDDDTGVVVGDCGEWSRAFRMLLDGTAMDVVL